jgi:hypothetical protein
MSRLGAGLPGKAMAKASLAPIDSFLMGDLTFQYNPAEFSLSKDAVWTNAATKREKQWQGPTYSQTNPARIRMEILFDAFPELFGDVTGDVQKLINWTKPSAHDASGVDRPPLLKFRWGASQAVLGMEFYLESVEAKYTLFRADGTPIRATCSIALVEATNPAKRQNPTSGGRTGVETHILIEGETLHSVAWTRFGNPSYWRALAEFNGIDDPLRVAPGTRLLIPARREAAALA